MQANCLTRNPNPLTPELRFCWRKFGDELLDALNSANCRFIPANRRRNGNSSSPALKRKLSLPRPKSSTLLPSC